MKREKSGRGKWEPKKGSEGKRGVGERRDRKSREWKMKDNSVGYGGGRKDRQEAARGRRPQCWVDAPREWSEAIV